MTTKQSHHFKLLGRMWSGKTSQTLRPFPALLAVWPGVLFTTTTSTSCKLTNIQWGYTVIIINTLGRKSSMVFMTSVCSYHPKSDRARVYRLLLLGIINHKITIITIPCSDTRSWINYIVPYSRNLRGRKLETHPQKLNLGLPHPPIRLILPFCKSFLC